MDYIVKLHNKMEYEKIKQFKKEIKNLINILAEADSDEAKENIRE